jgi:trans-aconitate 2-methyltransferase
MSDWDPELYNRFRRYRAEPFEAILARLDLSGQQRIVDLGCGSGENTVELARRAAEGTALGIDSSAAMIERANRLRAMLEPALAARVQFAQGDIATFSATAEYTLVFSNAALHWLKDHRAIFRACFKALAPGGQIVVQMPANDEETAKLALGRLAGEERWRAKLAEVQAPSPSLGSPEHYRELLAELGFVEIDCYYHIFQHPMGNPAEVVEWYKSTGLRPFLDALAPAEHPAFLAALVERLNEAYGTDGPITFPFRRLFIWGRRPPA